MTPREKSLSRRVLLGSAAAVASAGVPAVVHAALPFSGEDFGLFMDGRTGTYTYLGVQAPGADIATAFPHFPGFAPDEAAIGHGVRAMSKWLMARAGR
ncbi:hypothetical protein GCM10009830_46340 [Glycomyces endophyticus]|uniref:Uncharacterized protein n=1 Tax=Glycomyces endophyticus TaxID=480996 RepID=A0ABP4TTH4_9ACTN